VSYPLGDARREGILSQSTDSSGTSNDDHNTQRVEWTIRPDGNNFASSSTRGNALSQKANVSKSFQEFVKQKEQKKTAVRSSSVETYMAKQPVRRNQSHCHDQKTNSSSMMTARVLQTNEMTADDIATLGHCVWLPCRFDLATQSILWHTNNQSAKVKLRTRKSCKCFFNVETWTVVQNQTIVDLKLSKRSASLTDEMTVWTVCFQSRNDPSEVHWRSEDITNDIDIVPFLIGSSHENEGETVWLLPASEGQKPRVILNCDGEVLSCSFFYNHNIVVGAKSTASMKLGVVQRHALKSTSYPLSTHPDYLRSTPVDVPLPLPLPSASSSSLLRQYSRNTTALCNEQHVDIPDNQYLEADKQSHCRLDFFLSLTLLHSLEDVQALEDALDNCKRSIFSGDNTTIDSRSRQIAEWAEIMCREDGVLLKELTHLILCGGTEFKGDEEPSYPGEMLLSHLRRSAASCVLTFAHMCPSEFQAFLFHGRNVPSQEELSCICCGCSNPSVQRLTRTIENNNTSSCNENVMLYFVTPVVVLLRSLLEDITSLSSNYVKLHFSSPCISMGSRNDEGLDVDEEGVVGVCNLQRQMTDGLSTLSVLASLLLVVLTSSHQVDPDSNSNYASKAMCCRCSEQCMMKETPCDADPGGMTRARELLTLLQWALELSIKTSKLPTPQTGTTTAIQLTKSVYTSLQEVGTVLCTTCTPVFPAIIQWLRPQGQPPPSVNSKFLHGIDIRKTGDVLLSFLVKNQCLPVTLDSTPNESMMHEFSRTFFVSLCNCANMSFEAMFAASNWCEVNDRSRTTHGRSSEEDTENIMKRLDMMVLLTVAMSVSGLECVLSERQADILVNDMSWDIISNCLRFMTTSHCSPLISVFGFPRSVTLLSTLTKIVDLLHTLLFTFNWFKEKSGVITSDDTKENILHTLECCLDTMDESRHRVMWNVCPTSVDNFEGQLLDSLTDGSPPQQEYPLTHTAHTIDDLFSAYSSSLINLLSKCYEQS